MFSLLLLCLLLFPSGSQPASFPWWVSVSCKSLHQVIESRENHILKFWMGQIKEQEKKKEEDSWGKKTFLQNFYQLKSL